MSVDYRFEDALPVLRRTPAVLRELLSGLPDTWTRANDGPHTWSPYDVVGHLIHGERTDWVPRIELLLQHSEDVAFPTFEREAMFEASGSQSLVEARWVRGARTCPSFRNDSRPDGDHSDVLSACSTHRC